jgi:hypothetical protein
VGDKDVGTNETIVMEIMEPYFRKSYTLYTSKWYSLPVILYYLSEHDYNSIGTVRLNMPKGMKIQRLNQDETMVPYSHRMMAMKWQD